MGVTLKSHIDNRNITPGVMALMQLQAVEAIALAMDNDRIGHFDENSFVFDHSSKQLHFMPQRGSLWSEKEAVKNYGDILLNTIIASPHHPRRLIDIARLCIEGSIDNLGDLHLKLERRLSDTIYVPLLTIIALLLILLWWLNAHA